MLNKSNLTSIKKFNSEDVELLEQEEVYSGFHRIVRMRLRHRLYGGGWSNPIDREISDRGEAASVVVYDPCLLYTSPSPRDRTRSRMPSSA